MGTETNRSQRRATLSDIASMAGVSRQVVSAVLGISKGNIRYSSETHDRVMKIVQDTNFRPNRTAKNLVQKRHGAVGVLVSRFGHIPEQVLRGMLIDAHKAGQVLVLDAIHDEDSHGPQFIREDLVDGVVVFEDIDAPIMKEISRLQIPCVRVNTNVRSLPGCITYDEIGAMELAVDHLADIGRTSIAILAGPSKHYSMKLRIKGVEKACEKHGLGKPLIHTFAAKGHMEMGDDESLADLEDFLRVNRDVDSMILTVDGMAPAFYRSCARLGRAIPRDIAVVGVNNSGIALGVSPPLTSLYVHSRTVGCETLRLLNELIGTDGDEPKPVKLKYSMTVRGSTQRI